MRFNEHADKKNSLSVYDCLFIHCSCTLQLCCAVFYTRLTCKSDVQLASLISHIYSPHKLQYLISSSKVALCQIFFAFSDKTFQLYSVCLPSLDLRCLRPVSALVFPELQTVCFCPWNYAGSPVSNLVDPWPFPGFSILVHRPAFHPWPAPASCSLVNRPAVLPRPQSLILPHSRSCAPSSLLLWGIPSLWTCVVHENRKTLTVQFGQKWGQGKIILLLLLWSGSSGSCSKRHWCPPPRQKHAAVNKWPLLVDSGADKCIISQ